MKIKTCELQGPALDYVVAKIEEHEWRYPWMLEQDGYATWVSAERGWGNPHPCYSTDWAAGGPIIEREQIVLRLGSAPSEQYWAAFCHTTPTRLSQNTGTTPLIAAMRCYVANKIGDEVEVPDALCSSISGEKP